MVQRESHSGTPGRQGLAGKAVTPDFISAHLSDRHNCRGGWKQWQLVMCDIYAEFLWLSANHRKLLLMNWICQSNYSFSEDSALHLSQEPQQLQLPHLPPSEPLSQHKPTVGIYSVGSVVYWQCLHRTPNKAFFCQQSPGLCKNHDQALLSGINVSSLTRSRRNPIFIFPEKSVIIV